MKRLVVGAPALVAAGWTASAEAADLNYGQRAPYTVNQPLNAYSWAGPYIGGNLGSRCWALRPNPRQPIFTHLAAPIPSISRSTPIAGPGPISAAIWATNGAASATIRPSRPASPAAH